MLKREKMYMNIETGSVATGAEWMSDIRPAELTEKEWEAQLNSLEEVKRDADGDWIAA